MPSFGKTNPLRIEHFTEFENCFGNDPHGNSPRKDHGETGRYRRFEREEIADRGDNMDISWLRDETDETEDTLAEPEDIAVAILSHLRLALSEIETIADELIEITEGDK